jgi:hypothetical protein
MVAPTISTKNLTFAFPDGTSGLENVNLTLPAGSRNLLIGGKAPDSPSLPNTHAKSPEQTERAKQPSSAF